jgi:hypothetical protein
MSLEFIIRLFHTTNYVKSLENYLFYSESLAVLHEYAVSSVKCNKFNYENVKEDSPLYFLIKIVALDGPYCSFKH